MYTILLFLLLLANVFTTMSAMDDTDEKFPFHNVVHSVEKGRLDVGSAKTSIEKLFSQDKDPNRQENYRTAAQLSAYYCVNFAGYSEKQFDLLTLLLGRDSPENIKSNREKILEDLNEASNRLAVCQRGFKKAPFNVIRVSGGGSFINDENEDEERVKSKDHRIDHVRKLLGKFKN